MRYDVNFIVLGLLLVVIVAMIAMVFYYNVTYGSLRDRYELAMRDMENKSVALNKTMQEANAKEALLRERERLLLDYISELNISKERETSLVSHFTELKGEKEVLDEQLNQTRNERNSYASLYTRTKTDYDVCQRNYEVKATELNQANGRIASIKGWIVEVGERTDSIGAIGSSIQSSSGRISTTAGSIKSATDDSNIKSKSDDIKEDSNDIYGDASSIKGYTDRIKALLSQISNM